MINEKMMGLGKKRSCIREIFEYSMKRKKEIGADKVFDFSLGNPSIPSPAIVSDTLNKLMKECDPIKLHGYTSAQGDAAVRAALCENINRRFGFAADMNLMYMTCGAAASLTITLRAIAGEGDEVIAPAPFFPEYRVFVENCGATLRPVACLAGSLDLDVDAIEKAINKNTRAIIINSPNNPTGAVFSETAIKELSQVLEAKSREFGRPIMIIADEPYRELVYGDVFVPYLPLYYDNTVVCYSYSKSLSLPGERIGYIMVSPKVERAGDIYAAICGAGRSMGYVCAPSMWQLCVAECDGATPDIDSYDKNRTLLYNALTEIGYEAVRPDGAFYLFLKALEPDANAFCEKAKKYELLLVPSDDFGITGYARIAYCVDYKTIENSIPAFKALYEEYKEGK